MNLKTSNKKNIAVIPARGGSKRLPNKNILSIGGIPLLAHSILYAKNHDEIDAVYVSTDNEEIATIAQAYGAEVIIRPKNISGDHATTVTALQHVVSELPNNLGAIVLLQPTNPLRPPTMLKEAMAIFNSNAIDSLVTVSEKIVKLGTISENKYKPYNYTFGQRSQDITPLYEENGLLYITKANKIREGVILANNNYAFVIPSSFPIVDIDTKEDFMKAKEYFK